MKNNEFVKILQKPFVGGFYKLVNDTQIELHHAFSQTGPVSKYADLASRETQTIYIANHGINTSKSQDSQTANDGCFVNILQCNGRNFETFEEYETRIRKVETVIFLQKSYRKLKFRIWFRNVLQKCRENIDKRVEEAKLRHFEKLQETLHKIKPTSTTDFKVLYNLIENWVRSQHLKQYNPRMKMGVIEKEVEMLKQLDRKFERFMTWKLKQAPMEGVIKLLSEGVQWQNYKSLTVSMVPTYVDENIKTVWTLLKNPQTHQTVLASELQTCYEKLEKICCKSKKNLFLKSQLAIMVSQLQKVSVGPEFRKSVRLIYIEFLKVTNMTHLLPTIRKNMTNLQLLYCDRCQTLKTSLEFMSSALQRSSFKICQQCSWVNRTNRSDWVDFKPCYHTLLNQIRSNELKNLPNQSFEMFCVDESDIQLIFERIWHSRSIISDQRDGLTLSRWDVKLPWTPWNCILVTENEYQNHCDQNQVYCGEFIEVVRLRHLLAKRIFFDKISNEIKIVQNLDLI